MIAGSKLSCEGVIGDGCGGGRTFVIQNGVLQAHDTYSGHVITLLEGIRNPISVSKKACEIIIQCENEIIIFDLQSSIVSKPRTIL